MPSSAHFETFDGSRLRQWNGLPARNVSQRRGHVTFRPVSGCQNGTKRNTASFETYVSSRYWARATPCATVCTTVAQPKPSRFTRNRAQTSPQPAPHTTDTGQHTGGRRTSKRGRQDSPSMRCRIGAPRWTTWSTAGWKAHRSNTTCRNGVPSISNTIAHAAQRPIRESSTGAPTTESRSGDSATVTCPETSTGTSWPKDLDGPMPRFCWDRSPQQIS